MAWLKCRIPVYQGQIPSHLPDAMFNFTPITITHTKEQPVSYVIKKEKALACGPRASPSSTANSLIINRTMEKYMSA